MPVRRVNLSGGFVRRTPRPKRSRGDVVKRLGGVRETVPPLGTVPLGACCAKAARKA